MVMKRVFNINCLVMAVMVLAASFSCNNTSKKPVVDSVKTDSVKKDTTIKVDSNTIDTAKKDSAGKGGDEKHPPD